MKQTIIASVLVAAMAFAACNTSTNTETNKIPTTDTSKMLTAAKYTCTMHPEVISDTPGTCPKCEMKLVAVKDSTSE